MVVGCKVNGNEDQW